MMPLSNINIKSPESALETLKLFRIIFKSATRHFHEIEKIAGIGGASLWAMAEIAENDNLTVTGLAKAMSVHQSTASNLIEKLETGGNVIRTRSVEDRRLVNLSLTDLGREVMAKAPPPYRGILPDALMRLSPESLLELNRHLTELVSNMELKHDSSAFEPLGGA
ncbi:MarR family winged helix-turn-helix transcriptional regulator [Methylotenera versatilis]|uniref:Transcriptional regulator, MarR family n=1 Tax=Methylotenera versatilis (strain 301) TaxID=666681 RepID=D7DJF4_METV0|nr:MarR family transcriptional regulator [Methylotenera versatilis]ADI30189.1 transcriptional regulator, MarR family [Methylotenera versatilis 301]